MQRGSLYRLLSRARETNPGQSKTSAALHDPRMRLRMAIDIARGMNYLHCMRPVVVHRDLKSPNLLVDSKFNVKICDFGLARLMERAFLTSRTQVGTPEWMAPEILRNESADEKCDVYSFGVVLYELFTLLEPWAGVAPMAVIGKVGFQNERLQVPETVDPRIAALMQRCWADTSAMRPSFSVILDELVDMWKALEMVAQPISSPAASSLVSPR